MRIKITTNEFPFWGACDHKNIYRYQKRPDENCFYEFTHQCEETNNPDELIKSNKSWTTFSVRWGEKFVEPNLQRFCNIYDNFLDINLPRNCEHSFKKNIIEKFETQLNASFKYQITTRSKCKNIIKNILKESIDTKHYKENITASFFNLKKSASDVGKMVASYIDVKDAKNLSLTCKELAKDISFRVRK